MALVATGCTGAFTAIPAPKVTSHPAPGPAPKAVLKATLTAFNSCPDALAALRKAAEASVTPYGLATASGGGGVAFAGVANGAAAGPVTAPSAASAAAPAAAPAASGAGASGGVSSPAYSGTNDYTAGVDEPDLVKTDGQRIVTVGSGTLEVIDAASRQVTGSLDLASAGVQGNPSNLLLSGNHALLFAPYSGLVEPAGAPSSADSAPTWYGARFVLVDLSGQPRVLASYAIQGAYVDARLVGSMVRVITQSQPAIEFPPLPEGLSNAKRLAAYRAVTGRAGLASWLPQYETQGGGVTTQGTVPCTSVSRPERYSGTNLLTVLTFNMSADSFGTGDPVSVVADGDTVYGTTSSLYVASGGMYTAPAGVREYGAYESGPRQETQIYRFDITQPGAPRFAASGEVPGYLVDQYAMSEWNGYLRVATTTGTSWSIADGEPTGAQTSSSGVYVLTTAGPVMRMAGQVTGLGTSERIYSVRFMGPVGYVVTFRQTDPLYTLDLSDPARPQVVGSLGLTGFSAYLHPVSASQLIGIGQSADEYGHVLGFQISLFDVSDLAAPARLATYALAEANSRAEFDPHAFLYWPANQFVVVPIQGYGGIAPVAGSTDAPSLATESGALVLRITDSGISRVGFISPPESGYYGASIERSLVIGQTLWTVSPDGLLASDLATLHQQAWLPFSVSQDNSSSGGAPTTPVPPAA